MILASHTGPLAEVSSVVIPVACHAEMDGTFVNVVGRAQHFSAAVRPPESVRPAWQVVGDLAEAMGKPLPWKSLLEFRKQLTVPPAAQPKSASTTLETRV